MTKTHSIEELANIALSLRELDLESAAPDAVRTLLSELTTGYQILCIGRSISQVWWRARKCERDVPFANLHELIYPPTPYKEFGRANLPGTSVLYASMNPATALDEIDSKEGELIQLIALHPRLGIQVPCHVVGEYQNYYGSGRCLVGQNRFEHSMEQESGQDIGRFMKSVLIDCAITAFFREHVDKAQSRRYMVSALFCELMHSRLQIGLIYPSVKVVSSRNLALPPSVFDSDFEVSFTQVHRIKQSPGYGIRTTEHVDGSDVFEKDGRIRYGSPPRKLYTSTPSEGIRAAHQMIGWRKPKASGW